MRATPAFLVVLSILCFAAAPVALAAVEKHLIHTLPNQSIAMLSNHYSGYLEIETGLFVHYYLVESESDPKTDPLVFWTNGVSSRSFNTSSTWTIIRAYAARLA